MSVPGIKQVVGSEWWGGGAESKGKADEGGVTTTYLQG